MDPTPGNPPSASQFYKPGGNSIQSTVMLGPDAAQAASSVHDTLTSPALTSQIKGTLAASMSILMFSEGRAVAQLTFIGKLGDPVSADYLDTVGVIQLDAIQQNLSKVGG